MESSVFGPGGLSPGGVGRTTSFDREFWKIWDETTLSSTFEFGALRQGIWDSVDRNLTLTGRRFGGNCIGQKDV